MAEVLERWMYGDPLQAVMRKEAQSCKGCEFEQSEIWFNERMMRCLKDKQHGVKCKQYKPALIVGKQ